MAGGTTRPGAGGAGTRPSASQVNNFLDVPRASTGAVAGNARPGAGGAAGEFLQHGGAATRPVAGTGARTAAAGDRRQAFSQNQAGRIENRQQWQQNRGARANEVRNQLTNETPVRDFWGDHPAWGAWAITRPYRWATWATMAAWMGTGGEPSYQSYGEGTYYQDGAVYSGDQQVATADEYAQQAETLAESAPDKPAQDMQWMPLGVFALTQDGQASGAPPTLFMQLVLSKDGVISGTFNNKISGETQTLRDGGQEEPAGGVGDQGEGSADH